MNIVRKIIGLLIILFVGLPVLFAITIAVGTTQAAVSPELYSELPRRIIAEVPALADELVALSQSEAGMDSNSRAWLQAAAAVATKPHEVLEKTGILNWLQGELTQSLEKIGKILRGEMAVQPVRLDMRPLKRALQHEAFAQYLRDIMDKLPPCDESSTLVWEEIARDEHSHRDLPACRPAAGTPDALLTRMNADVQRDVPDEVEIFDPGRNFPRHIGAAQTAVSAAYLLFIIPAVFIALGALAAATSRASFMRWFGVSTGIGGLLALGFALLIERFVPWAVATGHFHYDGTLTQFREVALDRIGNLIGLTARYFAEPVISTAEIVCVVGLVVFALSFVFGGERRAPVAAPPAAPAA